MRIDMENKYDIVPSYIRVDVQGPRPMVAMQEPEPGDLMPTYRLKGGRSPMMSWSELLSLFRSVGWRQDAKMIDGDPWRDVSVTSMGHVEIGSAMVGILLTCHSKIKTEPNAEMSVMPLCENENIQFEIEVSGVNMVDDPPFSEIFDSLIILAST